ncbi:hypothetical protein BUALT_Bualt03G0210800 [Buddleja alternifolia]|uniref:DUF674 domain-containing protein n=1 Tax=Buddleja alternifolia TaxID=168488 RepID=A0AAV6Y2C5_9LAMI|nr:hypothetical protein BUALT_Bualt03G0210800 [Buddleja alternifolia]
MSAANEEVKFTLKALVNKEKTEVIFAEVDSDLADVLVSFLTLPLGKIVSLLEKHYGSNSPVIGSLNTLRKSLANLDSVHFWTEGGKLMLLNPRSLFEDECRKLKLNIDHETKAAKYFTCGDTDCKSSYVSMYYGTSKCDRCGKSLNREIGIRKTKTGAINGDGGVFTHKTMSFLISDDLQVMTNVPGSIIRILKNVGITNMDGSELRTVSVGLNEIMDLLKGSLLSKTPLTDLILHKTQMNSVTIMYEPGILLHQTEKSSDPKKVIVKALIQKSTNKFLIVQAQEDFVDFLFGLLTIPLGGVIRLLGCKTSLGSVDTFCRSIENLIGSGHLKTLVTENGPLEPMLPPKYRSHNQILSITEQRMPPLYHWPSMFNSTEYVSTRPRVDPMYFKDPKGEGSFVKRPGIFLVTDNLTVVPSRMTLSLSIVNGLKIPFSDVEEVDVEIGFEEALGILKASLTSTYALTSGLNSILKKQPKQEQ